MSERTRGSSRRSYLRTIGSAAAIGLAGCVSGGGGGGLDAIQVAYMPIFPDMQYFVMKEEGYFDELDATVEGKLFSDGPSIVQAYAKGEMEVAMFGIVPAMIVIDKGVPAQITNANVKNMLVVMGSDELAALWDQHGKQAFAKFEEKHGRKPKLGTFPPGSVPDIVLRYWLKERLGLSIETAVNIVAMAGAGPVRQALLAGVIDGTCIMEPVPTIIQSKGAPYQIIARPHELMQSMPGAVTIMHDRLRKNDPDLAKAFAEQHVRATEFINSNPEKAAKDASTVIGTETLPVDIARDAMDSPAANFISNPHTIADGAKIFSGYAHRLGKTGKELTFEEMFDYSIYDAIQG